MSGTFVKNRKSELKRDVIELLDWQAAIRKGSATARAPVPLVERVASRAELTPYLQVLGPDVVDAATLQRAIRPDLIVDQLTRQQDAGVARTRRYAIINSENQPVPLARVACLDLDDIGGVEKAIRWLDRNAGSLGSIFVVVAAGRKSQDLTSVIGRVHGVIPRPRGRGSLPWEQALAAISSALAEPIRDDTMADDVGGAISPEEFAETMFQASLLDEDPRKRD